MTRLDRIRNENVSKFNVFKEIKPERTDWVGSEEETVNSLVGRC